MTMGAEDGMLAMTGSFSFRADNSFMLVEVRDDVISGGVHYSTHRSNRVGCPRVGGPRYRRHRVAAFPAARIPAWALVVARGPESIPAA